MTACLIFRYHDGRQTRVPAERADPTSGGVVVEHRETYTAQPVAGLREIVVCDGWLRCVECEPRLTPACKSEP